MSWSWAALMPHPPVIVPEVGRGRELEAAVTLKGVEALMERLSERKPDTLLVLSPHQPCTPGAFFLNASKRLTGSFAPFGAPSVEFDVNAPSVKSHALAHYLLERRFPVHFGEAKDLTRDHGALVPLYYLRRAWKSLPSVVFASPIGLNPASALRLGQALADFSDETDWALLASGDLSHRLTPDAPAGYSLFGKKFDEAVVAALLSGDPRILTELSPKELDDAGECGLRSVLAMLGLCGTLGGSVEVLSYEGPFGVGYCNAVWKNTNPIFKMQADDFNI